MTSREFNQDSSGAKRAAEHGPVVITDRGRPSHVLLTYASYERLVDRRRVTDLLGEPSGVEDIAFTPPASRDEARPAHFD